MIRYKKYKSNQTGVTKNKWYGRAVTELMEFEEFVKHMATITACSVSPQSAAC